MARLQRQEKIRFEHVKSNQRKTMRLESLRSGKETDARRAMKLLAMRELKATAMSG
jgi:hypothetical protein